MCGWFYFSPPQNNGLGPGKCTFIPSFEFISITRSLSLSFTHLQLSHDTFPSCFYSNAVRKYSCFLRKMTYICIIQEKFSDFPSRTLYHEPRQRSPVILVSAPRRAAKSKWSTGVVKSLMWPRDAFHSPPAEMAAADSLIITYPHARAFVPASALLRFINFARGTSLERETRAR